MYIFRNSVSKWKIGLLEIEFGLYTHQLYMHKHILQHSPPTAQHSSLSWADDCTSSAPRPAKQQMPFSQHWSLSYLASFPSHHPKNFCVCKASQLVGITVVMWYFLFLQMHQGKRQEKRRRSHCYAHRVPSLRNDTRAITTLGLSSACLKSILCSVAKVLTLKHCWTLLFFSGLSY